MIKVANNLVNFLVSMILQNNKQQTPFKPNADQIDFANDAMGIPKSQLTRQWTHPDNVKRRMEAREKSWNGKIPAFKPHETTLKDVLAEGSLLDVWKHVHKNPENK